MLVMGEQRGRAFVPQAWGVTGHEEWAARWPYQQESPGTKEAGDSGGVEAGAWPGSSPGVFLPGRAGVSFFY